MHQLQCRRVDQNYVQGGNVFHLTTDTEESRTATEDSSVGNGQGSQQP